MTRLEHLAAEARACKICAAHLPLGPRPVLRPSRKARLLVVGQAPGRLVHETGLSWNDRSGDRLRSWMGVPRETFYDQKRVALLGIGFCYPGVDAHGGDLPPRPECAPTWHQRFLDLMPQVELILLVGIYAHAFHLGKTRGGSVGETVAGWQRYLPRYLPLPHPSWRNTGWLKRNPWFEADLVPELRKRVTALVQE